jgi:hypothetical protein
VHRARPELLGDGGDVGTLEGPEHLADQPADDGTGTPRCCRSLLR